MSNSRNVRRRATQSVFSDYAGLTIREHIATEIYARFVPDIAKEHGSSSPVSMRTALINAAEASVECAQILIEALERARDRDDECRRNEHYREPPTNKERAP